MNGCITAGNRSLTGESAPVARLLFLARDLLLGNNLDRKTGDAQAPGVIRTPVNGLE
jgi:hypothetical protein